ncbi:MAG TPA: molybdenum cofactor guanylyltransferase [Pyrinomonadaceae bacterium]|nr:molybdenum cofactor guanylyltransferase [Pyrinomonadaceae bacterium]
MVTIAGFILAGGESRRMGTDKSRLVLNGESFVERIAAELETVTSKVTVVGKETNSTTALQHVPDIFPKWGTLGGVHTALASCEAEWCLIVACDFPFVTAELFARLASLCENFEAVAPIQSDGIPQPLCSLYQTERCLERAEELINSGERKPIALLQSVRTRWVPFAEIQDLPGAERYFDNINTPEDYDRIVEKGTVSGWLEGRDP